MVPVLYMFSRSIIDESSSIFEDSRSIIDYSGSISDGSKNVIDDSIVMLQLVASLMIIIYDCHITIV